MAKGKGSPSLAPMLGAILSATPQKPERAPSPKQLVKEHAKHSMRRATEDWVDGRISTKEHNAVHARGKHVLEGKHPRAFRGPNGEKRMKLGGLR